MTRNAVSLSAFALAAISLIAPGAASAYDCGGGHGPVASIEEPEAVAARFVGLTPGEAGEVAAQEGRLFRVVSRDGEDLAVTRDFQPGRINAVVVDGVIVDVMVEGAPSS